MGVLVLASVLPGQIHSTEVGQLAADASCPIEESDRATSLIVSADVSVEQGGQTRPPGFAEKFLNFDGTGACLAVRQYGADGKMLAEDFSLAAPPGRSRQTVETILRKAAVRFTVSANGTKQSGAEWGTLRREAGRRVHAFPKSEVDVHNPSLVKISGISTPPFWFHAQNFADAPLAPSLAEARLPAEAGIPVITFNGWFPGVTSDDAKETLEAFAKAYPAKHFMIRLWLGPPSLFFKEWPEERMGLSDGRGVFLAPPASKKWLRYVRAAISRLLMDIQCSPAAGRLVGVIPLYYLTGEWQVADVDSPFASGPGFVYHFSGLDGPTTSGFARWLAAKGYPETPVPSPETRAGSGKGGLANDPGARRYGQFHASAVANDILESAQAVKMFSENNLLVGVFFGYLLEHPFSNTALHQLGHLALPEVLDSPQVDFVGSPYSYAMDSRFFGKPIDINAPMDSFLLHGKAAFLEDDTYTHKAGKPAPGLVAPGEHQAAKDSVQTMSILVRNWAFARIRGYQVFYMSLLTDGRFNLPEFWNWFASHESFARAPKPEPYRPVVAAIVSAESLHILEAKGRAITTRWLYEIRASLSRTGTSVGYYLQSDLPRIPDSARCLVFLTPYSFSPAEKLSLEKRWKRDGRVLVFCQAPAIWDGEKAGNPEATISGIDLKFHPHPIDPASTVADGPSPWNEWSGEPAGDSTDRANNFFYPAKLPPVAFHCEVVDKLATPLAHYNTDKNKISCAMRTHEGWTSVFLGSLPRQPRLWQQLIRLGNGHLYLPGGSNDFEKPDFVDANGRLILVQSAGGGTLNIHLPFSVPRVRRIDTPEPEQVATGTSSFPYTFKPGQPVVFEIQN